MIAIETIALVFLFWRSAMCQTIDPLVFPKDSFTVETKTVQTAKGERAVTYHLYLHIPYVAHPVDSAYQSLNVSVPVKVGNEKIDPAKAPILLAIHVGGYMSSNNYTTGRSASLKGNANTDLALAAGYVVVSPGCRGRENKTSDGTYYGKAPAAIVDLKAAVRYIRHNKGVLPGNTAWIFSTGVSAGGALSALLGASGNNEIFLPYLKEIGAAEAEDHIFGSACFCPITDLEHADGAYEWMYGTAPISTGMVDQDLSKQLRESFTTYQTSLNLQGKNGFGPITAGNYDVYLLQYYLIPSANKFLKKMKEDKRTEYLAKNVWITWADTGATFTFPGYVAHVGRMKGLPAFDDFDLKQPEPILFGNRNTNARHFTDFSLRQATNDKTAEIDNEIKSLVNMMNPMYFIGQNDSGCARHWWLRQGTSDNHTSQTVIVNLATSLENRNKDVDTWLYWDAKHGADEDAKEFIAWIGCVTGFTGK